MQVISDIKELKELINSYKKEGVSVGYVPTMGFLHEGHLSLIERARKQNQKVIVSIFVNPLQFGANEDLDKYPRDLERDENLCENAGVDVIFAPKAQEFYGENFYSFVDVNLLGDTLCGAKRAGHFRGVCTVLSKFFHLIEPQRAYFGLKDAQQCAIVRAMVRDLNMKVKLEFCPIVRENDNLAKSSRNVYLSEEQRKAAPVLYRSLCEGQRLIEQGEKSCEKIKNAVKKVLENEPLARIDYVEIVDFDTMKPLEKIKPNALCAIAVFIGQTRLIDNFLIEEKL